MESKTIKISEENYRWLLSIAAELQKQHGRPISFDETLNLFKSKKMKKKKLSDLAGSWKMTDREAKEFLNSIRKGWKRWKIQSV